MDIGTVTVKAYGSTYLVTLYTKGFYRDGTPVIRAILQNGESFATLSVCVPGTQLGKDEYLIKTWSENQPLAEAVRTSGLFIDTGRRISTGFVQAEVWKLS